MLKKEDPLYEKRHKLFKTLSEKDISFGTRAEVTLPMNGKPEEEKERIAEKLLEIVLNSNSEEEMIHKSREMMKK